MQAFKLIDKLASESNYLFVEFANHYVFVDTKTAQKTWLQSNNPQLKVLYILY